MEWIRNPMTGTFKASIHGRDFTIEPAGKMTEGWEVWYGVSGRRLRVGLVATLEEAKNTAEDVLAGIRKIDRTVGD